VTATAPDAPTDVLEPVAPARRSAQGRGRFLLVCVLIAAAVGVLLYKGLMSSLNYFDTVDQAFAHRSTLGTQTFRLEGTVVPGTIRATATGSDFSICQGPHVVHVANTGSPPALFQARIGVVVVGHFTSDTSNDFVSDSILVKHSATYSNQYPNRVKKATGAAC